nr:putative reverse transcriptase domain-containing protein [Tanacetum cinerariifolium]
MSLATSGKADGITYISGFALGSFSHGGVKVLSSSGVAPYCDDTIKALEAKHPYKPLLSMPSITFSEPPLVAEIDSVFGCIKLFPKCTSCVRDGLRAQHILDALCGEGSPTATDLLKVITSVINLWFAGRCPPILAEFVASPPLMHLLKPDNGIQLIAVGTIWRRLVSKVAMKGVGKEMSKYLSDFQFGVRVSCGADALLHSVNRVLSEYHNDGSLAMLIGDFSNAFNFVDRSALLHEQHDPLGPILFALILNPLLHKIKDSCKLLLLAWPSSGVKLLGGAVIRDANFISGLAMRRAASAVDLMNDDYISALACLRDTFPSFDFSGFTNKDTALFKAQQTLTNVLFSEIVKDIEVHFDMTMRQKAVFKCLCAPHAPNFLLAILIDGIGQHMSPVKYRIVLEYRLMIPLIPVDAIFPVCCKACLDSFGEHVVHCNELPRFKYRHDMVRDVLLDIWNHVCVDLTRVSPLVGLSSRGFTAGQDALKAASCKVTKHEKTCIENQHVFIPFAFGTFGFLAPELVELLS